MRPLLLLNILVISTVLAVSGCGTKGDPLPPQNIIINLIEGGEY